MTDKDDFWNIDRILPKNKTQVSKPSAVDTVAVSTSSRAHESGVDVKALFNSVNAQKGINSVEDSIIKERDYSHFDGSRVISYAYVGKYSNLMTYDNRIRSHALATFMSKPTDNARFVDYFSYNPSFTELSGTQLDWYLRWREDVRCGIYTKTSISYVLLYVCEIINLPDKIPAQDGIEQLIAVWENCAEPNARYDRLISDIILEYCIVHDLVIPYTRIGGIVTRLLNPMSTVLGSLYLFDYLLAEGRELSVDELRFLFEKSLGYSYSASKHYSTNDKLHALLDTYFYKVLNAFIKADPSCINDIFARHEARTSAVKIIRPTFLLVNASPEVKKNIVFEYYSFEKTDTELLYLHNIAKQIENRFRSECGIRARLTVSVISDSSKAILDSIFKKLFKNISTEELAVSRAFVRKTVDIDISNAERIEESSWETTKMLVEGIEVFSEDESYEELVPEDSSSSLDDVEKAVLRCLLDNNPLEAESICSGVGAFLDGVIATINEKLMDRFGDTVIDTSTSTVYDDYADELLQLFI